MTSDMVGGSIGSAHWRRSRSCLATSSGRRCACQRRPLHAAVDVQLDRALVLADHVVEVQAPQPGTRPDPVVLAGGDVGVEGGLRLSAGEEPLPEPLPDPVSLRPHLADPLLLLAELDLIGGGFRQGDHLLDVDQQATAVVVRLHADAPDVQPVLVEPDHGGGQLLRELRRRQDDADVLGEEVLVAPSQPRNSRIEVRASISSPLRRR